MRRLSIISLFLTAVFAHPAAAAELQIHLPPDSTVITFELKATLHTVHGTAKLESGNFTVNTETGSATGEAVVAAASADTDNKKRDKKMHGKVLLSAEHPRIVIRADGIEGDLSLEGTSEVVLVGVMKLLGADHPVRIPITVVVDGGTTTVDASFSVPYVEWGLDDPSTFLLKVGKEVPVTIHAEGVTMNANGTP